MWQATDPRAIAAIRSLSALGWLIVLGTFLTGHFKLLERKRAVLNFAGRVTSAIPFRTPGLYRFVRHPLYLGFILAFWATPAMTAGHLLFASVMTAYIGAGIWLEERDLAGLLRRPLPAVSPARRDAAAGPVLSSRRYANARDQNISPVEIERKQVGRLLGS